MGSTVICGVAKCGVAQLRHDCNVMAPSANRSDNSLGRYLARCQRIGSAGAELDAEPIHFHIRRASC